jgi:ERCC4-type nuclease
MKLLVDNREPKDIISIVTSRLKNVEIVSLDIGDFVIKNDKDEIVMIFERKKLSDLIASIKDGRYTEQSFRLSQAELNNHNIFYIIEGNIMGFCLKNKEPMQKMLFSSMLSLSYKKGFSLLHTSGTIETAEFLVRFTEKLETESKTKVKIDTEIKIDNNTNTENDTTYSSVIKMSKKSNITKENINEIMLAQIPGVSITVAQILMNKYHNIKGLINALTENNNCLDEFKIEFKNGSRKLSKSVISNLQEFLDINKNK